MAVREVERLGAALARQSGQNEDEAVRHLWGKLAILLQRGNSVMLGGRGEWSEWPMGINGMNWVNEVNWVNRVNGVILVYGLNWENGVNWVTEMIGVVIQPLYRVNREDGRINWANGVNLEMRRLG